MVRCVGKEQSLLFDLFKAFAWIESSRKSKIFLRKDLFACASCSDLPSDISTMGSGDFNDTQESVVK